MRPSANEIIWNAAAQTMGGEGVSGRGFSMADPPLHILVTGEWTLWCTGSRGHKANTLRRLYCPRCLRLAKEMHAEYGDNS